MMASKKPALGEELFAIRPTQVGLYQLEGELTFASVEQALKKTAKLFTLPNAMVFDLANITRSDSAGLALLLEWRRQAEEGGARLRYVNLPRQLQSLAKVVGIDELLILE
ncbi:MAG: STAS domain-containing protein [Methylococcaceae bacterium]|nr:STAS domain-containing protein [Methylococcaceae bacterium]